MKGEEGRSFEERCAYDNFEEAWMPAESVGANITRSALMIVDMQNDFLHRGGDFAQVSREHPEARSTYHSWRQLSLM